MKHVLSLALLAAAPALSAAAPVAPTPAPVPAKAEPAPPSIERQMLARRYVTLALPPQKFVDGMRFTTSRMVLALKAASGDEGRNDDPDFDKYMQRFMTLLEPKLRERVPNIMEAYAQAYAREFTADELQQMVTFAQSPAGQHYLAKQLDIGSDPAVQIQEQGLQGDVPAIIQQLQKERCAEHTAQRIAAGDTKAKCPLADKPDVAAG